MMTKTLFRKCLFYGKTDEFVWLEGPVLIMLLLNTAMFCYIANFIWFLSSINSHYTTNTLIFLGKVKKNGLEVGDRLKLSDLIIFNSISSKICDWLGVVLLKQEHLLSDKTQTRHFTFLPLTKRFFYQYCFSACHSLEYVLYRDVP